MENKDFIRNFAIISHVDHGKSTLADRFLEITGTVGARQMREQYLDSLELERERGITIKLKAVRMTYQFRFSSYQLNMIDTPGHVDFGYEVSRSLAACEGAILVVDASQGVQAQTVSNVYKAMEHGLTIIPFVNKIDLSVAQIEETIEEIERTFDIKREDILLGSAKEGTGVRELIEAAIQRIPPPSGSVSKPLRALIFDSMFDEFKGVAAYVRLIDGEAHLSGFISSARKLKFLATGAVSSPLEIGFLRPQPENQGALSAGEVGYIATGLKEIRLVRVGDTVTTEGSGVEPLPGYREPKPMVFLGLYPTESTTFLKLRSALDKLHLTDSSLVFEAEGSGALGMGFRCGFLGLLHADVVQERLERDYNLRLISTTPSVSYEVRLTGGDTLMIRKASDLPDPSRVKSILEPYVRLSIFTPDVFSGPILKMAETRRARFLNMEYLGKMVHLAFEAPLAEVITDFYNCLKSISSGFASLDYEFIGFREGYLCRLDILVAGQMVAPLSQIVPRERSHAIGAKLLLSLKETIERHQFVIVLQAAIGGKIIAREEIPAMRKNVLAKMSGGHRERKDKLLDRQREGKQRLKKFGRVTIPQEAFRSVLERS